MATNANRVIVHTRDYSSVRLDVYSTGAAYFRWVYDGPKNSTRDLLRITNAKDLLESGHLEKFAKLLEDESTHRISSKSFADVLEYYPERDGESFRFIIDSSLAPLAKVIYLISYASLKFPLGKEELELIFSKRPDPQAEWSSHATAFRTEEKSLVRYSLMPGFYSPEQFKDRNLAGYSRIALTSAFIHSERSVTHGEFMEKHKDDFFIPHLAVNMNEVYFRNFPPELLSDLRPAEYIRFMEYFTRDVPPELAAWAKKRFASGVVTLKESRSKGSAKLQPGNMRNWMGVASLLSLEEARAFQADIMEPNGIGSISSGVEKKLSPLLAYYYAEGGKARFNELVQHIIANGPGLHREVFRGTELQFNWRNPYSESKARRPNLKPYVEALVGENSEYPLEWSLAVIDVH